MKRAGSSIAGLLKLILVVALGAAALHEGSETRVFAVFVLTVAILIEATLRSRFGPERDRAWWFGFAVFGWAHLGFGGTHYNAYLPTFYFIPLRFYDFLPLNRGGYPHNNFLVLVAWTSLVVAYLGAVVTSWYAKRWSPSARKVASGPNSPSIPSPEGAEENSPGRETRVRSNVETTT